MARQKLPDMFELAHPCHCIPDTPRFKIRQRQRQDMSKELRAQLHIDPIRRMREEICAKTAERRIEYRQSHHPDREDMEGGEALMDQDLVDDHLCEQRRQQRKQLQEERSDQDLPEKLAVLDNGRNEPSEIEFQILQAQIGAFGEEEKLARPSRFESLTRQHDGPPFHWILDEHLVAVDLGQYDVAAIGPLRDRGKGGTGRLFPLCLEHTGFQAKMLGRAEEFVIGERLPWLRKPMTQLRPSADRS